MRERHRVYYHAPQGAYGEAVGEVWEDETGAMWAGNGEYATRVSYNPFTGQPARSPVALIKAKPDGYSAPSGIAFTWSE